jgi:hypothetical protein
METPTVPPIDWIDEVVSAGLIDLKTLRRLAAEAELDARTVAAALAGFSGARLATIDRIKRAARALKVDLGDPRITTGKSDTSDATSSKVTS